jgi:ribosome-associated heat shock protein Hsp15
MTEEAPRIDKWLWAVRVFKTRSQASEACRAGKVRIENIQVKPSREIKIDDVITINLAQITMTIRVVRFLHTRIGAKLVSDFAEDLTTADEYNKQKLMREINFEYRERGSGRPTKKERRMIEKIKKSKF